MSSSWYNNWINFLRHFPTNHMRLVAHDIVSQGISWLPTYRGADKSLAQPGMKQAAPVKSVMGRGMDWFG